MILYTEACIANDRGAFNGNPVCPASRWSASIICHAAINKRLVVRVAILSIVWLACGLFSQRAAMSQHPFPRRMNVEPFPDDLTWINTSRPIRPDELRGKFVLLDFWTYCCINCMHILPELKKLEKAYPRNLVVIGVHSAKFEAERVTPNIAEAVLRYNIEHPVINDSEFILWKRFGVQSWPTIVLIDPEGQAVWHKPGETKFEVVDAILKKSLAYYRKRGVLDETPLSIEPAADSRVETPLRFPGKILADEPGDRLFIADSGHHRIVVTRLDGTLIEVIGAGQIGSADGDYARAQFSSPQGMALDGERLWVADTENHLIRQVDLAQKAVTTVAGTGEQLTGLGRGSMARRGKPLDTPLASPWALAIEGPDMYVAMAGTHQIWRMRLNGSRISPYAGNGREDIVDGPLLPRKPRQLGYSSFAQPSGLASDGKWLFVADSEGSSIRAVPLDPRKKVRTLVGTANLPEARLFTFGDVDGPPSEALLQHPLGVVYYQDRLYVADTYNNKIKVLDPAKGVIDTLAGLSGSGDTDFSAGFDEPAGLTAAKSKIFVADTNNHRIRVIDMGSSVTISTLDIDGLKQPGA